VGIKKQRKGTGPKPDRFMIYVAPEMGKIIRKEADIRGLTYSKLIGEIFEEHFNPKKEKE